MHNAQWAHDACMVCSLFCVGAQTRLTVSAATNDDVYMCIVTRHLFGHLSSCDYLVFPQNGVMTHIQKAITCHTTLFSNVPRGLILIVVVLAFTIGFREDVVSAKIGNEVRFGGLLQVNSSYSKTSSGQFSRYAKPSFPT